MLCNISFLVDSPDTQTSKLMEPERFEVLYTESDGNYLEALIAYEADPRIYDSGTMLTVVFRRNETWPDAPENGVLDLDLLADDTEYAVLGLLIEVLPQIPVSEFFNTVTRITLETVQGELTTTISEDVEAIISYLPVPQHLSHIMRVPINELLKERKIARNVDRVKWRDQSFAFKRTDIDSLGGTIQELTILNSLRHSQYIIHLDAIVIDEDNLVRGFLMPYMPAGDLTNVFREGRKKLHRAEDDESEPVFDWSFKLSGHPTNVLLNILGQAILIDFLPIGITDEFAAPELLAKFHDPTDFTPKGFRSMLTAPVDIYSLGLLLHAIALDKTCGAVQFPEHMMVPTWYPTWYLDIVKKCVVQDPAARPSAAVVLSLLHQGDVENTPAVEVPSTRMPDHTEARNRIHKAPTTPLTAPTIVPVFGRANVVGIEELTYRKNRISSIRYYVLTALCSTQGALCYRRKLQDTDIRAPHTISCPHKQYNRPDSQPDAVTPRDWSSINVLEFFRQ
ncbi:hypothetical protein M422DRAFT_249841 [Sphaerobolus stellatus SS14]|uniref:Protein kinase domain-containing protein n=1 Tax=Sphaerobolus stellatus (strain SS14) TaxID=990650 RepID=A0A0C9VHG0_SPHS4|nr:hypothetical protein M422DRAFT_249841 [Sphaerobolus stellatus SS14]